MAFFIKRFSFLVYRRFHSASTIRWIFSLNGKLSPQYRVLERNLQHMKEEQERTETDLMKLLYERAEERYRTLEVRDGEFRTEEIKNILAGKKELETFDENLYRKIIARIWVHGGNMAEVEFINGSRVTAGYKD